MGERINVFVYARDHVTETGLATGLRSRPELRVVGPKQLDEADVAVVATDEVDEETVRVLRALQRGLVRVRADDDERPAPAQDAPAPRAVLVVARPDEAGLLSAVEAGVSGLLRRNEATPEALAAAVRAAASGDGTLPPDLLGRLLSAVGRLQRQVLDPRGLSLSTLNKREVEVLRLVADGNDTAEIARALSYSERTIKNIIHDVTMRLGLRNRTHAVAYAVREGLI